VLRAGAGADCPPGAMRWRYLVSRSMTKMASITLKAKATIASVISLLSRMGGPPVGPVPPAPGVEVSPPCQPPSPPVTRLARFVTIQRICKFSAQCSPITRVIIRAPI